MGASSRTTWVLALALPAALVGCKLDREVQPIGPNDATVGDGGSADANPGRCSESQRLCGDTCVDLLSSAEHCGECDRACEPGQVCDGMGACSVRCSAELLDCGGSCIDPLTNRNLCGASGDCANDNAGQVCSSGEICSDGNCVLSCVSGQEVCDGACRDLSTDRSHCGSCEVACDAGEVCSGGRCGLSCGGATPTLCGAGCVNTSTDARHCGGCDEACGAGQVCSDGVCMTSCGGATPTLCDGRCVDTATDRVFCGADPADCSGGAACQAGQFCSGGSCSQTCGGATPTLCGDACVDTQTSRNHCGGDPANCEGAQTCAAGEVCSGGTCQQSCGGDTPLLCGTACVNPELDRNYCGAQADCQGSNAGAMCEAGEVCAQGSCQASCAGGLTDCGGTCRNTDVDPAFCGGCDNACATLPNTQPVCVDGGCGNVCLPGYADCNADLASDGCESDPQSDTNNCGGCGLDCVAPNLTAACSAGACSNTCVGGFHDCDGDLDSTDPDANGCETPVTVTNCASCGDVCSTSETNAIATCLGGSCGIACQTGFVDCNGDLGSGGNGCEAMGSVCPARIFVTSAANSVDGALDSDGSGNGLGEADATCQAAADASGLGGRWRAWLSATGVNANTRLTAHAKPIALIDYVTRVADNFAGLTSGTLQHAIDLDETGATVTSAARVYTGTDATGKTDARTCGSGTTAAATCGNWTTNAVSSCGTVGDSSAVDSSWSSAGTLSCNTQARLYCLEQ